ncbi:MAG: tetratricopeptide repeat protein, partial [Planctomycetales bacterium]
MKRKVSLEFEETPLTDVAEYLASELGIPIKLNQRALDDAGIAPDSLVSLELSGIPFESALRLMLDPLNCTTLIRDDVLLITTQTEAEEDLSIRIYKVGELVKFVEQGETYYDWDSLVGAITSSVEPNCWDEVGGPGSVQPYANSDALVISTTDAVHRQVETLLRKLRKAQGIVSDPATSQDSDAALRAALRRNVTVEFVENPLSDVVLFLSEGVGAPVKLDVQALDDEGIPTDSPISMELSEIPLRSALRLMLDPLNCTMIIRHDVLLITTQTEADMDLTTRVYPVEELVSFVENGETLYDWDSLIDMLTSTVEPNNWDVVGGPGSIMPFPNAEALIVSTTDATHPQIENVLNALRKAKGLPPKDAWTDENDGSEFSAIVSVPRSAPRRRENQDDPFAGNDGFAGPETFVAAAAIPANQGRARAAAPQGEGLPEDDPAEATANLQTQTPQVEETVRRAMQDRKYPEAIKAIATAAAKKDAPRDYLTYLQGRALFLMKRYDEALAVFKTLEKDFPKSPWVRKARFSRAICLTRKRNYLDAELIYRQEAEYLTSPERKQQVADIYLKFADEYFKPADGSDKQPNYSAALKFYEKSLGAGPRAEKRAQIKLLAAQCEQNMKRHSQAAARYAQFVKDHPQSELVVEARYRLGVCLLANGGRSEARRAWEDLLALHPQSNSERIPEAAYGLGLTHRMPKPDDDEQLSLGVAALERFLKRFPKHELAARASLLIIQARLHRKRHEEAVVALKAFLANERFAESKQIPDARRLLGAAYRDQKKFVEAVAAWREYLAKHPTHPAWSETQRAVISAEYFLAAEALRAKRFDDARALWQAFLIKYPLDDRAPGILFLFGEMNHKQKKWEEAMADWRRAAAKYPKTNEASRARFRIAQTLDQDLAKLDQALEAYRKVVGSQASAAKREIQRLTGRSLRIETERVFRSDETPRIRLTTRNIKQVTVKLYAVDMETYFRKMHTTQGVEQLDVALISPSKTIVYDVPNYVDHQEFENRVEVPLPKGQVGAMAATVTSSTLEATTLVLQSDLEVIVKSSRNELLVFAENMRTGKPWPNARLLVSDGGKVFVEGTTDKTGILRRKSEELKSVESLQAFAASEGHVASTSLGLSGMRAARGLSSKGYVYTDRPAYQAGQLVHVRGILRTVKNDEYVVPEDAELSLRIIDPNGRVAWNAAPSLNAFGSFHARFTLSRTSRQGTYRMQVTDDRNRSFNGEFLVAEYKLEPVRLTIETERRVFYRGEEIEGEISASFYYGAPAVNQEIRYQFAGGRSQIARTDDQGKIRFKLPTRQFRESRVVTLAAQLPQRNLAAKANFFLSAVGFSLGVKAPRAVYLAGETFDVEIKAVDAEGKPAARDLQLQVLEITKVDGGVGERLVAKHALRSDKETGAARQTLKLDRGGRYRIRALGTDRFDHGVSGETTVHVSDDEDSQRLRILADRHAFKVGETAEVRVHWREDPALALITHEGAGILGYHIVKLKKGVKKLPTEMTEKLAPNFELAV